MTADLADAPTCKISNVCEAITLDSLVKGELYWIAREALLNAFRHAGANNIMVLLDYGKRQFRLTCRDNGCGMSEQALQDRGRPGHFRLTGMRERARRLGAEFRCSSADPKGTCIEIIIPERFAYEKVKIDVVPDQVSR